MSKIIEEEFDENNNRIYFEYWSKYDENDNLIYWKNTDGRESWVKYDKDNNWASITEKEFKQIEEKKRRKEFLSRKISRFSLMDI